MSFRFSELKRPGKIHSQPPVQIPVESTGNPSPMKRTLARSHTLTGLVTPVALDSQLPIDRNPIVTIKLNQIQSKLKTDFHGGRIFSLVKCMGNKLRNKEKEILCCQAHLGFVNNLKNPSR